MPRRCIVYFSTSLSSTNIFTSVEYEIQLIPKSEVCELYIIEGGSLIQIPGDSFDPSLDYDITGNWAFDKLLYLRNGLNVTGQITTNLHGNSSQWNSSYAHLSNLENPHETEFIQLTDCPSGYIGQALKFVIVNSGETGLTFSTSSFVQRPCDDVPVDGSTTTSISSNWAFDHNAGFGNSKHVPVLGTSGHFLAWDGTFKSLTSYIAGGVFKVTLSAGGPTGSIATRLVGATFPSGWSGAIDAITTDLNITHTVGKAVSDVTIWADDLTNKTKLIGSAAYSTVL